MAKRIASAQKQARKSVRRRQQNRAGKQALKEALKKLGTAGTPEEVAKLASGVQSTIDRSAKRRLIHRKTANRLKARLARAAVGKK